MDEQLKILQKIGLSDKQALVYSTLLGMGEAKMTDLARQANLKRPTVYLIIDELDLLGLISTVTKGKRKMYSAVHPKRIGELLDFRKNQFQELLPEMLAMYGTAGGKPKVQMLEGIEGVKQAYREAFALLKEEKNEGLWIGNISILSEAFPEVLQEYQKTLNLLGRYKVRELIFGGEKSKEWVLKMQKRVRPSHKIKYFDDRGLCGQTDQFII
jgi:sugar-specific transcriptional regulator TrmB